MSVKSMGNDRVHGHCPGMRAAWLIFWNKRMTKDFGNAPQSDNWITYLYKRIYGAREKWPDAPCQYAIVKASKIRHEMENPCKPDGCKIDQKEE